MSDPIAEPTATTALPLVSVLVLTWNQSAFIGACVASILAESYRPIEIVICDNGSPDDTWARLEEIRDAHPGEAISIFRNPPATPVTVGFNSLLKRARGEFVCFFSGDDLFCGDRIAKQVETFQANPDLQVIYSNGAYLGGRHDGGPVHDDSAFARVFAQPPADVLRYVFSHRAVMIQTMMARRALIETIGGFDEDELADDWILNIRIFSHLDRREQYAYLPIRAFLYRQHEGNAYRNFPRQSRLMIGVIEKYYHFPDRRRELASMYWFQSHVGAMYGFSHLRLTTGYLRRAIALAPDPVKMAIFAARFTLAPALRAARHVRSMRGGRAAA